MSKKLTAKDLLKEVRQLKKQAGGISSMEVTPWYETTNHPQVQKAFKEIEKELRSFVMTNGLSNFKVKPGYDWYSQTVDFITTMDLYDQNGLGYHFGLGAWDPENTVFIESDKHGVIFSKTVSGNIDKDVAMAVSYMKKFIDNELLDWINRKK